MVKGEIANEKNSFSPISVLGHLILGVIAFSQWQEAKKQNLIAVSATQKAEEASQNSLALQEKIARAEKVRSSLEAKRARAPHLVVERCCNQVPIAITPGSIGLRRLDIRDPKLVRVDQETKERCERAFVVRVGNVGPGVAIGSKAFWEIQKIVLSDGSIVTISDEDANAHMKPYLWPNTIRSGETADLLHLPSFLLNDSKLQVVAVSGFLLLTCNDIENDEYSFRQEFTIDTVYSMKQTDDHLGTRLSFHFYERGASPHTVAKPLLDWPDAKKR